MCQIWWPQSPIPGGMIYIWNFYAHSFSIYKLLFPIPIIKLWNFSCYLKIIQSFFSSLPLDVFQLPSDDLQMEEETVLQCLLTFCTNLYQCLLRKYNYSSSRKNFKRSHNCQKSRKSRFMWIWLKKIRAGISMLVFFIFSPLN